MTVARSVALAGILATSLLLAGCTIETAPSNEGPSASETAQPLPSQSSGPIQGEEALKYFATLSKDSCDAAMSMGLVEETNNGDKMIMVPKDEAYNGHSAVFVGSDGTSEIIYELDYFITCGDALYFWQLEEAGEPLPTDLSVKVIPGEESSEYRVTRDINGKSITYTYKTKDNLIVFVDAPIVDRPDRSLIFNMTYSVSAEDRALLEQIVDKG